MNNRNGFVRLALVVMLPWAAYWGYEYWDGKKQSREAMEASIWLEGKMDPLLIRGSLEWVRVAKQEGVLYNWEEQGRQWMRAERAWKIGLCGPAALAILLLLALFVGRGFRSTPAHPHQSATTDISAS